ncbi:MAG TPA: peptidylprolyl isomerase [Thermoanaerobaculaceae bacterium]|nr:peptidylprolyl isomerase [Thermoanaerobaculaceae bacterium]
MTRFLLLFAVAVAVAVPAQSANPRVKLETTKGTIVIELDQAKAPITVNNFLEYVKSGFYNGTIFHRVIPKFMVQGGGFTPDMQQRPTREPIANESANGLPNKRGTLAMARTPEPNSASSQFFINLVDNDFLDRSQASDGVGYCVFGKVVEGMPVVDAIAAVKTGNVGQFQNVPLQPVVLKQAVIETAKGEAKPPAAPPSAPPQPK